MATIDPKKAILSKYVDAASVNIPTSYGTGANSKIMTGMAAKGYSKFKVINNTDSRIALCFVADKNASAPSSSNSTNTSQDYIIEQTAEVKDFFAVFDALYLRSDTGSIITTGLVIVEFW